ncbi:hypothetical protein SSTU70S_01438 [Stutzerimonas stutzeri]
MNVYAIRAIYLFELARTWRTLLQSIATPVISTSLYFVVFGSAIGARMEAMHGIPYGAFIIPGLIMMALLSESISNASFGIYMPRYWGTIYEVLSAPVSYVEIVIGYVGAAATKSLILGVIILITARLFVDYEIHYPLMMALFVSGGPGKVPGLDLKTVLQANVETLAGREPRGIGPTGQIVLFEAQPEIAAGLPGPALVVAAQLGDQQAAARFHQPCQLFECLAGRRQVMQHHVQHHAVGCRAFVVQRVGQLQLDVVQTGLFAAGARQFEHRRAVVQRHHVTETTGQFRQEAAVAGADFQRGGGGFEVQRIEQRQHAVAVLRQAGEQVLAGLEAAGHAREEVLAGGAALRVDGGDASLYLGGQLQLIDFFEQRRVQFAAEAVALRQVAPVEDRVAFAAGGQQAGLGQHLQMVTHAGLADGEVSAPVPVRRTSRWPAPAARSGAADRRRPCTGRRANRWRRNGSGGCAGS